MSRRPPLNLIREAMMSRASTRAGAEALVQEMLLELEGRDDDEVVTEIAGERLHGSDWHLPDLTVSQVRERLRWTLAELAARDGANQDTRGAG